MLSQKISKISPQNSSYLLCQEVYNLQLTSVKNLQTKRLVRIKTGINTVCKIKGGGTWKSVTGKNKSLGIYQTIREFNTAKFNSIKVLTQ